MFKSDHTQHQILILPCKAKKSDSVKSSRTNDNRSLY